MRRTIPTVAVTALALASAAFAAHAAGTAGNMSAAAPAPGGSVLGNPNRTTTAPLTTMPGAPAMQANVEAGPFSPASPNTVSAPVPSPTGTGTGSSTVTANGPAATNVTTNPASTNANPDPFGANSTFANDNNNGEFGILPGFPAVAGNPGSTTSAATVGTNGTVTTGTTAGTSFIAPVDMTGGVAYGNPAGGVGAPGYSGTSSTTVAVPATTATPLLNQVTATEINKEARQRAQGREPRVIGIAPRTEVDRTRQMPDDPIIRY